MAPKRKLVTLADDADKVLKKCRQLREELKKEAKEKEKSNKMKASATNSSSSTSTCTSIVTSSEATYQPRERASNNQSITSLRGKSIVEVHNLSSTEVIENIESIAMTIVQQVLQKNGFTLEIPSRTASNQIYVPELGRIVLGEKRGTRSFLNVKEARKAAITTRVMQLLHEVLR
eukprot:472653_1